MEALGNGLLISLIPLTTMQVVRLFFFRDGGGGGGGIAFFNFFPATLLLSSGGAGGRCVVLSLNSATCVGVVYVCFFGGGGGGGGGNDSLDICLSLKSSLCLRGRSEGSFPEQELVIKPRGMMVHWSLYVSPVHVTSSN